MDFQSVIMTLDKFWADHGCLIWHPYNVQVGAGTMNPATVLRVLGPEPWNVAYLEPSVRPADGRYGKNPNRWQQYYQYQVILKPDPGNPQELYLQSLQALGIDTGKQDVRFVEDNWESPALGAWGLGWEVWLNGQEISQYTYFQQAGGMEMDPVSVEITYGLERIVMALQGVRTFPEIAFSGDVTYGDIHFQNEVESCIYNFEVADVDNLHSMYDLCEAEAKNALARDLIQPAHDYVLKCSHIFNVLDARGAVGVTERARYFVRMRNLARDVAAFYAKQREELGYPLKGKFAIAKPDLGSLSTPSQPQGKETLDLLFEIGSEELPVGDLDQALEQLGKAVPQMLQEARLACQDIVIQGTPRRLAVQVSGLQARQEDQRIESRGPAAQIAFDAEGNPTRAALGFARGKGVEVADLERRDIDGREYVLAVTLEQGREACQVLAEALPELLGGLNFARAMRWNQSRVSYSRPLRWYVALLDDQVVPFEYADVRSGRTTRGIRPQNSPELVVASAADYVQVLQDAGIMLDADARQASLLEQARALAAEVGGVIQEDPRLVREVANLVEFPLAIRGQFEEEYLRLPDAVLLAVMHKHQRYLPVLKDGNLLPYYVTIANGASLDVDAVRYGNDEVLRARYADAAFFYDSDIKQSLDAFTPRLETLTFEEHLGSVLDKVGRIQKVVPDLAELLGLDENQVTVATRAAALCKSDLATQMVVELTSLQGIMGRHYAFKGGEPEAVAQAIEEHYLPRSVGDRLPDGLPGVAVGLADRLDTLVGLYAVGIRPRGTADPWGLRRTALSMLLLLVEKDISLALPEALSTAAEALPVEVEEDVLRQVLEFITVRYRGYLLERGYRYDLVDAVLNERGYDPALANASVQALTPWTERDDWQELLDSYARCVRITRDREVAQAVAPAKLITPEAQALYATYAEVKDAVVAAQSVDALMQAVVTLKPAITSFFDEVLVMDKDEALRNNRIALLQAVSALAEGIVDLSVVEGF